MIKTYKDKDYLTQELIIKDKFYKDVAKENSVSETTIIYWAKKFGVKREAYWDTCKESHGDEIKTMYQDGKTLSEIQSYFGYNSYEQVKYILRKLDVPIRDRFEVKINSDNYNRYRKYDLNFDYFKSWNEDMAYVLGLIASDGCIKIRGEKSNKGRDKTSKRLTIALKDDSSEVKLLEEIKKSMGYTGKLHFGSTTSNGVEGNKKVFKSVSLTITSKDLVDSLISLNINPNKSLSVDIPKSIPKEFMKDFIRGYFDGDGSIEMTYPKSNSTISGFINTPQLRMRFFSGSKDMIDSLSLAINEEIGKLSDAKKSNGKNLFTIEYSTKDSLKIYDWIYQEEGCIFLDRKREIFDECILLRDK